MAYRDRTIGELGPDSAGTRVQLAGWVASRRDHGGMVFFNLRDGGCAVGNLDTGFCGHRLRK